MFEQTYITRDNRRVYYLGVRFTEEERDFIKKCAIKRKVSISNLFRMVLKEQLKEEVREAKALRSNTHM
jgi:hypothetical protein